VDSASCRSTAARGSPWLKTRSRMRAASEIACLRFGEYWRRTSGETPDMVPASLRSNVSETFTRVLVMSWGS
jgi:hypothetical protein